MLRDHRGLPPGIGTMVSGQTARSTWAAVEEGSKVSDSEATPKNLVSRVEENLRADVEADEGLGMQMVRDLVEKVEALEKRIAELERRP